MKHVGMAYILHTVLTQSELNPQNISFESNVVLLHTIEQFRDDQIKS